jgi:oxalate decarboxylase/phosphoglucose isomerase-like protein (cupin superfamily)
MKIIRGIKPEFVDERGGITRILDDSGFAVHSILYITSKAGTTRSNHYHKTDAHWSYLLSGKMDYYEKPVEGGEIEHTVVEAGDMVFSDSMMIHTMKFTEDSVFLAFSRNPRNQKDYEADTVRVELVK